MSLESKSDSERTTPVLEFLRVMALLVCFVAQLYWASLNAKQSVDYCFTKPLWLDEFHTLALVSEQQPDQLLIKLSRGGDYNPPGLYLTLWAISKFTGPPDELLFRIFSFVVGVCGLISMYFLLRIRFSWLVSWVAVLGMWSNSALLLGQMFEGRFYSFWFAALAVFCLLLNVRAKGIWHPICVVAFGALICSIHYFGIISLGIVCVSQFCCNYRDSRQRRLIALSMVAGLLTVFASLPLYWGQRAALPVPTWVNPPSFENCTEFMGIYYISNAVFLPLIAFVVQKFLRMESFSFSLKHVWEFKIYSGTFSLILLPVVLVIFSYAIQPAQVDRYALPAVLAYAPMIALICARLSRLVLVGLALCFFAIGVDEMRAAYRMRPDFRGVSSLEKKVSVEHPLVVHSRDIAYPLFRYNGFDPKAIRVSYSSRGENLSRIEVLENAVARRMAELFELPNTIDRNEFDLMDEFYLFSNPGEEIRYQGWTAEDMNIFDGVGKVYRMRRNDR